MIVIGAGASGMYLANLFHEEGVDVKVLEASDKYGGRVRTLSDFADFGIELGAEYVHGQRTDWHDICKRSKYNFADLDTSDYMMLDGSLQSESAVANDSDVQAATQFLQEILDYSGPEITVEDFAAQRGIPDRIMHLVEALMGNEYGTTNDKLSVNAVAAEDDKWKAGTKDKLLADGTFVQVFEESFPGILDKIELNSPVDSIDYSGEKVSVTTGGTVHTADAVFVTVSLAVLKAGLISFTPALSDAKTDAIDGIGMDSAMKVILKFTSAWWPADTGAIVADGPVPEYWTTATGRGNDHLLTAFVMGSKADYLSGLGTGAIQEILADLDNISGDNQPSSTFEKGEIMDWTLEPYVLGGYSYPNAGSVALREVLAAPVDNKVYFAGEATHTGGHLATVHGAIETAARAFTEFVDSL